MPQKALQLINLGISPEKAACIELDVASAQQLTSVNANVTAAGTVIGDATQLTAISNRLGTVASSTGVRLPRNVEIGGFCEIRNDGANTVNVWPAETTDQINNVTAGSAFTIATNVSGTFRRVAAARWITV
jgi:hypothetical protein